PLADDGEEHLRIGRHAAERAEVVLGGPDRVEAGRLGRLDLLAVAAVQVARRAVELGDVGVQNIVAEIHDTPPAPAQRASRAWRMMSWPVTRASSPRSISTIPIASSGSPILPVSSRRSISSGDLVPRHMGVFVVPGATAFTVMPCGAISSATERMKAI